MSLRHLISRPISPWQARSWCSNSKLLTAKIDPATTEGETIAKVTDILEKALSVESGLEPLAQSLTPRIVSWVVRNPPSTQLGFRFFIWATRLMRLRTWKLHDWIIGILIEHDGFDLYWKTLEELRDGKILISSGAFLVLILGYWRTGDAERAVDAFAKIRVFDCLPNVFAYNAILYVMVQKEVIMLALAVYNQMLKSNCCPNVATYSILMDGLCKSGNHHGALRLLDEMILRSIPPNNTTYSILLSGLCRAKRAHDALMLFNKMESSGCQPDEITYKSFLNGLCKTGMMDEAFMLFRLFETKGYDVGIDSHSCIIDGLFRAGRFEEANEWFRRFCEGNRTPDLVLYTIMIRGFSESGRVRDSLGFIKEMGNKGLVPDTQCYNVLIKGFCNLGLLDEARSLKLEISENNRFPSAHTYTILISSMCERGLIWDAKQIFEEMEKVGCSPPVVTFNALINGLCKGKKFDEARLLLYKMETSKSPSLFLRLSQGADRVLDTASLQKRIERLCELGSYVEAYGLLRKLVDSGVAPNIDTYNILINGMCKARNIEGAFKISEELQLKGLCPDLITYGTLIDGLCRVGKDETALKMLDQVTNNGVLSGSSAHKALMTWLCRKRKVYGAFSLWLKYLKSRKYFDDTLIDLLEGNLLKGDLVIAIRALLEVDLKMKRFDLGLYTIWLIGLCQARDVEGALKVFHMLEKHNIIVTAPSRVMLIRSLCNVGKLDLALDVFQDTLEKGVVLKRDICNRLLTSLLNSNSMSRRVFDLLSRMESKGYDVKFYLYTTTRSQLEKYVRLADPSIVDQETVPHLLQKL